MPERTPGRVKAPKRALRHAKKPARVSGKSDAALLRIAHAVSWLSGSGQLRGVRSTRVSTRVDPGLLEAARKRTGIANPSDLVNAALAVLAADDDFGPWLIGQAGRLPNDFELAI